jgi:hypothetical protein
VHAGALVRTPLNEAQDDHGPLWGSVCQICQSALSVPIPKTSSRPSEFCVTATECVNAAAGFAMIGSNHMREMNSQP